MLENFDFFDFRKDVAKNLFYAVQHVHGNVVEGDIAEFGTMSGQTAMVLAAATAACEKIWGSHVKAHGLPPKHLHLFDSFIGLPEATEAPDRESPHVKSGVWKAGSCKVLNAEQLRSGCESVLPRDRITIHDGWFKDTIAQLSSATKFSLLHIDCDLYSSTMDVLLPLFRASKISDGAMILFDDWNCNRASPDFGERKAWAECIQKFEIKFSDCGCYGYDGHKFIVHSYRS